MTIIFLVQRTAYSFAKDLIEQKNLIRSSKKHSSVMSHFPGDLNETRSFVMCFSHASIHGANGQQEITFRFLFRAKHLFADKE